MHRGKNTYMYLVFFFPFCVLTRQCITVSLQKCYNEKLKETNASANDSIRPWLKSFVESVGIQRAKILLDGAGNFSSII